LNLILEEFQLSGGEGEKLQNLLVERGQKEKNWLEVSHRNALFGMLRLSRNGGST